mgnify:CR=1 FL=1
MSASDGHAAPAPRRARRAPVRPTPLAGRRRLARAGHAGDPEREAPRAIPRLGGVDPRGVLDVGASGRARARVGGFLAAAQGKPRAHRAGSDFHTYDVATVLPLEALRVDVLPVDDGEVAEAIELALLEDYRFRYKDRPPLHTAGKHREVVTWLERRGLAARDDAGWLNVLVLLRAAGFAPPR